MEIGNSGSCADFGQKILPTGWQHFTNLEG